MKKVLFIMLLLTLIGCKNEKTLQNNPIENIKKIGQITSENELKKYYSSDTVNIVEKLEKKYPDTDVLTGLDRKIFSPGFEYEIVESKCTNEKCSIEFVITNHKDINFVGIKINMMFEKENNSWKIDRSSELKKRL